MRLALLVLAMFVALLQLGCGGVNFTPADAGPRVPPELACATLVEFTCGAAFECEREVACEAARLLAAQDAAGMRCLSALDDPLRFPGCVATASGGMTLDVDECTALIDEVCGGASARGERACADAVACANAMLLARPAVVASDGRDPEVEAQRQARCLAALDEEALYPTCRF